MKMTRERMLSERIVDLERTVERLNVRLGQLQRQLSDAPETRSPTTFSGSCLRSLFRGLRATHPVPIRANKRIEHHVNHLFAH